MIERWHREIVIECSERELLAIVAVMSGHQLPAPQQHYLLTEEVQEVLYLTQQVPAQNARLIERRMAHG